MAQGTPVQKSGGEYLNHDLPSEMLAEIGKYLDLNSNLKLRLVLAKARERDVFEMLKHSLKVVYVSPSRTSLRNFKQICQNAFFQQHIVEVVFMPKVLDIHGQYFERCLNQAEYQEKWTHYTLSAQEIKESWRIYQKLVDEHWWSVEETDPYIEITLTEGLCRFSNLKTATVSCEIAQCGINRSTLWYTLDQNAERMAADDYTIRQCKLGAHAASVLRNSMQDESVQEFYDAIKHSRSKVETLRLGDGTRKQLDFDVHWLAEPCQPELSMTIVSCLRRLQINCEDSHDIGMGDQNREKVSVYWWERLARDALALQELDICTGYQPYPFSFIDEHKGCKVLDHFLRHGKYASLRKLTISSPKRAEPSVVDAVLLVDFLVCHADTLKHVALTDILVTTGNETTLQQVHQTYHLLLTVPLKALSTFKTSLYRLPKHVDEACSCRTDPTRCQQYLVSHGRAHVSVFDWLARQYEVDLNDDSWDFGEVVMRRLKV